MNKQVLLFISTLLAIANVAFSQIEDTTFQDIEAVIVTSEKEKKIVFEDTKYYIVDFTISENRALLLMKNFSDYIIYVLDKNMEFRHQLEVNLNADALFDDCFGNTHLVAKDSVYLIEEDSEGLFLTEAHPRLRFMNAMKKCVGSTSEKIIFENRSRFNQFQKFHTVDIDSGDRKVIYEINDSTQAKSLEDASEQLTAELRMNPGAIAESHSNGSQDKAGIAAHREMNARKDRMNFFKSHLIRPKYNPVFVVDDTLYFFNHAESRIDQMDDRGNLIYSQEIDHHTSEGWENKVHSDKGEKRFYAVKSINGVQHLTRLSLSEGEQEYTSKITKHAYPKKVIVRNGYAFYTYKPNFDANLNKLYRQKL